MGNKLKFTKLKRGSILQSPFETLAQYNEIEFSDQGIAIIYAPNGTGKTTIAKILCGEENTEVCASFEGQPIGDIKTFFHVIHDQLSRNIISGTTDEFILGENIAAERQLKTEIDQKFNLIINALKFILKEKFIASKQSTPFIDSINKGEMKGITSVMAKKGTNSNDIDLNLFSNIMQSLNCCQISQYDDEKMKFFLTDLSDKKQSIITKIRSISIAKLMPASQVRLIEQNDTAISILTKYHYLQQCVVCETPDIEPEELIERKKDSTKAIHDTLNAETKKLLDNIIGSIGNADPFGMRDILINAIETGNVKEISKLLELFNCYQNIAENLLNNEMLLLWQESGLAPLVIQYKEMVESKLELQQDDEILIQDIIAGSLGRSVILERDSENNIIIKLDNTKLLGTKREDIQLSTGEQNFISLAFELLKAKKSPAKVIVMDDPISSFDSIYKNKIAYCIVKILEQKQQIVFTHNIDLVRLMDVQRTHCFNLYLLSNDRVGNCGFIKVQNSERSILLYLDKLLDLLRSTQIDPEIIDEKTYIISLIPFMRAIVKIVNPAERQQYNDDLTKLMHGYNTELVDITPIYNLLFGKSIQTSYKISAIDIIELDVNNLDFMRAEQYPLLKKTLRHTLIYLFLRLNVEYKLRTLFPRETRRCELLGDFIYKALSDITYQKERVQLTAKKTLLNEFNHYEGNFNIFQPAIDITDSNLEKEKQEILSILNDISTKLIPNSV